MKAVAATNTNRILRLEGMAVLGASIAAYYYFHLNWGLFALLLLLVDVSMLGYWISARVGALIYNSAHSYIAPLALLSVGLVLHIGVAIMVALIWSAHIGMDRALGFGLKGAAFDETHLGSIRQPRAVESNRLSVP